MPITPRQQPDGSWVWVDSATGQPAQQPGGQGTPYVAPSDQVPAAANIDPNASRAPDVGGPTQGPASPGTGTTPPVAPTIGAPQGPQGMFTVDQATETAAREGQGANVERAQLWDKLTTAQKAYDDAQQRVSAGDVTQQTALTAATTQLNAVYTSLSQASQRVETANAAYSTALGNAMKLVDPTRSASRNHGSTRLRPTARSPARRPRCWSTAPTPRSRRPPPRRRRRAPVPPRCKPRPTRPRPRRPPKSSNSRPRASCSRRRPSRSTRCCRASSRSRPPIRASPSPRSD